MEIKDIQSVITLGGEIIRLKIERDEIVDKNRERITAIATEFARDIHAVYSKFYPFKEWNASKVWNGTYTDIRIGDITQCGDYHDQIVVVFESWYNGDFSENYQIPLWALCFPEKRNEIVSGFNQRFENEIVERKAAYEKSKVDEMKQLESRLAQLKGEKKRATNLV